MPDRYAPHPRVLFKAFADGAVLYAADAEAYWGLNDTGAQLWSSLPKEWTTYEEILSTMATRHPDAPPAELARDLGDLLDGLVRGGLLQRIRAEAAA
jgi:hypothetical protein